MIFKKYNSIENSYQSMFIDKMKNSPNFKSDVDWVVEEKIHGSNLSLWYDGKEFKVAKRTGWIVRPERFFSLHRKWDELKELTIKAYNSLYIDVDYITIYGEWFGGTFPELKVNNAKKVQKGIYYTPDNEFMAFDFAIDGKLMPLGMMNILQSSGFMTTEQLFKGTLDKCLEYPNEFPSTIPKRYGLTFPVTDKNICEGVVIKPVIPMFMGEKRMIIKNKNEKFQEISKRVKREPVKLSDDVVEVINEIELYVTDNRFSNVLSKVGISDEDLEPNDIGNLLGLFYKDIVEDYNKNTDLKYDKLDKKSAKLVNKHLNRKMVKIMKGRM